MVFYGYGTSAFMTAVILREEVSIAFINSKVVKRIMKRVLSSSTVLMYYTPLLVHIISLDCTSEPSMLIDLKT